MLFRGRLGLRGEHVDVKAAMQTFESAAAHSGQGAADAMCALARLYEDGVPGVVERDLFRAVALYNASALAGNASAQFTMGVLYSHGLFRVPHDDKLATLNLYLAAIGGSATASLALG